MSPKKIVSKAAKEQVSKVFTQAKESLKLLENAKSFVKFPNGLTIKVGKSANKETILASLRKLGMATQDDVAALRARIEHLEAGLATHQERHHGQPATEATPQP